MINFKGTDDGDFIGYTTLNGAPLRVELTALGNETVIVEIIDTSNPEVHLSIFKKELIFSDLNKARNVAEAWIAGNTDYGKEDSLDVVAKKAQVSSFPGFVPVENVITAEQARDIAIGWSHWAVEQSLSYDELATWGDYFGALAIKFPTLSGEFNENGITASKKAQATDLVNVVRTGVSSWKIFFPNGNPLTEVLSGEPKEFTDAYKVVQFLQLMGYTPMNSDWATGEFVTASKKKAEFSVDWIQKDADTYIFSTIVFAHKVNGVVTKNDDGTWNYYVELEDSDTSGDSSTLQEAKQDAIFSIQMMLDQIRLSSKKASGKNAWTTIPAGTYYLGDPCYTVVDSAWMPLLESCNYFEGNPVGTLPDGKKVYAFGTAYGDGRYKATGVPKRLGVDSGMIGLTPVGSALVQPSDSSVLVTFDANVKGSYEDGVITFGQYDIDTN